jgi:two-component system, response regulator PdtaR
MLAHLDSEQRPSYVLVVEDEALIRVLISEELRTAGLSVIEASNADEAWSYAAAGGPIDLLFSDFQMPGSMSGLELARKLKQRSPNLDVIITSGRVKSDEVSDVGAFLAKPYLPERAVAAVLKTLKSRGGKNLHDA